MRQYFSILAVLILCFSATTLRAQIVIIPDANFKAYLVGFSSINTNGDSEIQISEAQAFNSLIDVFNLNISDLTGIEEFINITGLYCGFNQLTSIDVSSNTQLQGLRCRFNQITSLDVSNNPNLVELWCNDNQITSLNVSNTSLTELYSYNNQLTVLDVSSNNDLITLYTGGNQITTLDLSQNFNLVDLDCSNDSLSVLNVKNGNNTNFTAFNASNNPNLICIEVDDDVYSANNWTNIDATATFSVSCFSNANVLGVEQLPKLQIYPNPTPNNLTIDLGTIYSDASITISNAIGQRIETTNYNNTQILDLEIKGLPGWYFIQIETEKGSQTVKVLKQ